ncbi:hypothetical protein 3 [Changjiang tombus-like virus 5]|uniref:hypothetical protein 3 n=1 Tax=Changjiang tombus-like virus 5 TaxID=1922819 RepID=UPI00090C07E6|nr:hypothetical protein 3 [Changjiang tombus-like virus 5]APG76270.1 hypothetical protein 3 [Changjiang tombus-like virus 5]
MAKTPKNKGKSQSVRVLVTGGRKKIKRKATAGNRMGMSTLPARWMRLLTDPCLADLTYPCYGGTDAGYLVRTVDTFSPTIGGSFTVGSQVIADGIYTWSPWNLSATTGTRSSFWTSGDPLTPSSAGFNGNFISTAAVRSYRPVASCLKWVPIGPIGGRSGLIASGYSPGVVATPSVGVGNYVTLAQRKATNGTEMHEINWLPTSHDEEFTTVEQANSTSVGTVFMALKGVDAVAKSSTSATLNGYFEITTVWEWTPATTTGLCVDPRTPSPYTSQTVLSMFGDIKNALFAGAHSTAVGAAGQFGRKAVGMIGGVASSAAMAAIDYAGRSFMGVANNPPRYRGNSVPLIGY